MIKCFSNVLWPVKGIFWLAFVLKKVYDKTLTANTSHPICILPSWFEWASLVAQTVKNLPGMQETRAQSLGWEDPLEKGMATHSSILAWKIPWTEEPGSYIQSMVLQRVGHDWANSLHFTLQRLPKSQRKKKGSAVKKLIYKSLDL